MVESSINSYLYPLCSMERILERYERYSYAERQLAANEVDQNGSWTLEHAKLKARMEVLQRNQRHFMGEDLDNLSLRELQNLEQQLDSALKHVRSRKNQLMFESISELQKKDKALQEQNNMLAKKVKISISANVKEKEQAVAQQAQWEQQNNCQDTSAILLPQPMSGTYEARSSGREEEGNPAQHRGANALLPPWMIRHLE
ncbi:Transcription factor [Theobroma cacao]|nr:Transcription factor [Theobroma cacao]